MSHYSRGGFGRPLHVAAVATGLMLAACLGLNYAASGQYRTDGTFRYTESPTSAAPALRMSQSPLALPDGTQPAWVPGAALLEPGHRVDVLATVRADDRTRVVKLLSSALVVEVRCDTSPGAGQDNRRACLALTSQDAELLAQAQNRGGSLNLVPRNSRGRAVPHDPSAAARLLADPVPGATENSVNR